VSSNVRNRPEFLPRPAVIDGLGQASDSCGGSEVLPTGPHFRHAGLGLASMFRNVCRRCSCGAMDPGTCPGWRWMQWN